MIEFFEANQIIITIQAFIFVPFTFLFLSTLNNARNSEGRLRSLSLYFALFSLMLASTYIFWTLRALYFSDISDPSDWLILWQLAYGVGVLGFYFLSLWALTLLRPELLEEKKYLYIILLVPWLLVMLDIFILTTPTIANNAAISYAFVSDIQPDLILQAFSGLAVGLYSGIPILLFLSYLRASENKGTTNYRKIAIIEIGLILFTLGTFIDATKIDFIGNSDILLFVFRISIALGAVIMFFWI